MFKMALFDCAINEKCYSVDGGRAICPLISSPPGGIWQLKSPHPLEFVIQGKKMLMPRGQPGRGGGVGAAGIDWCITFWKRKKTFDFILKTTFSHQNNGKTVDNSLKTKQIWDWKKKTRTKVCLVSIMTYNLSLPVLRSSVMTKRTSTKLKPTPHLISPEKFKKSIFIIKILLVNFNDVYGIISYWLNKTTLWAWCVGIGDGAEL